MSWNLDEKQLFRSGALGEMRGNKTIDNPELLLDTAVSAFAPNEEGTVVDELMRFREYIKTVSFKVQMFTADEMSVGIQMPAGDGYISLGLRASLFKAGEAGETIPPTQTEIDMTAVNLLKTLLSASKAVQTAAPNLGMNGATKSNDKSSDEVVVEQHDSDSIEVGTWKGKTTYKIRAGWFTQFGASVYPETLKACGFESVLLLPVGTTQEFKHKITVHVKDGKPVVKKIE